MAKKKKRKAFKGSGHDSNSSHDRKNRKSDYRDHGKKHRRDAKYSNDNRW